MKFTRTALLLAGAFAIGCSSDSSTAPSSSHPASLDAALKEFSFSNLSAFVALSASTSASPATSSSGCNYNSTTQSFVCTTTSGASITASQSFQLLDGSGTPQSKWGDNVAAIHMKASASGTSNDASGVKSFEAATDLTLGGLITGVHTLDGTATSRAVSGTGSSQQVMSTSVIFAGLVLPNANEGANAYPKAGTVTASAVTTSNGTTVNASIQMKFNGTSNVPMVFVYNGITVSCTVNLASSNPSCIP
jgi:hypothetical protein